jgi:hypothetical protein
MVNVYDVTNASDPLIMYGPARTDSYHSPSHVSVLDFGDPFRKHEMKCRSALSTYILLLLMAEPHIGIIMILQLYF